MFPGEITTQKFCAGGMWMLEDSRSPPCLNWRTAQISLNQKKEDETFTIKALSCHFRTAGIFSVKYVVYKR